MTPRFYFRPICLAIALASGVITAPNLIAAETIAAKSYRVPAGPLGEALARFAAEAGISLSYEPALTQGKHSAGLQGVYDVAAGLAKLLEGSGLEAVSRSEGGYTLRATPLAGEATLRAVKVQASGVGGTTERSGSYTTESMNSATRLPLSIRETPQSVSVITRQQMDDQNLTSVVSVLERSVGISVNRLETDRSELSARGFLLDNIQFDGIPTRPAGMQDDAILSDTALYDRVEIVRGATGLLTGVGDPSATVNVVRKRPAREFQGYVSSSAGRWDAYRIEADVSGPLTENGAVRGRLVGAGVTSRSQVDEYSRERQLFYGVVDADLTPNTLLTIGVDHQRSDSDGMTYGSQAPLFYSDGGRTRFSRSTTTGADWTFLDSERTTAFAMLEHHFSDDWQMKVQYHRRDTSGGNRMIFLYDSPDRATGAGVSVYPNSYDNESQQENIDLYVSGATELWGRRHEFVFGWSDSDYSTEWRDHPLLSVEDLANFYQWSAYPQPVFGEGYDSRGKMSVRQDGLYAMARLHIADPLKAIVGARLSSVRYRNGNYPESGTATVARADYDDELTPYAGIVYDFADHYSAYASYTQIFKYQTNKDREGSLLDPLTGTNYEAGVKSEFHDGRLYLSAAIFRIEQDNFAEFDTIIDGEYRYRAVNGAKVRGYELEVSGEPLPCWNLSGGFTRRLAESGDGGSIMTREPQNLLRLNGTYQLQGRFEGFSLGARVAWQSEIRELSAGPQGQDGTQSSYTLVDLFGSYRVNQHLRVQANLNNVFDKVYYSGMTVGYGQYGEARNLTLSAKYQF